MIIVCTRLCLRFSVEIGYVVDSAEKELALEHQFSTLQEEWIEKVSPRRWMYTGLDLWPLHPQHTSNLL